MTDDELAELVARCGNIYTRFGLSPPMALRDAAKRWAGLSQEDVARVVEDHLRSHRRLYVSGFSDAYFGMVQSAIRKAIELKHPARDHVDDEPERPRPSGKRRGIREIYTAGGYADAIDDREDTNSIGEDAEVDA